MTYRTKRIAAVLLVLVLCAVGFCSTAAIAATGTETANTGIRHETCTSLSSQAQAYYTDTYTWDNLLQLEGGTASCLDTDNPLFSTLHTLMTSTMTKKVTYTNLKQKYPLTDTANGYSGYILFYSDVSSETISNNKIAREHVWPKSHATFYEKNGGCDLHHLRPTNQYVNASRSNDIYGNVRANYSGYTVYPTNSSTPSLFKADGYVEVNDNIKGDVARILLYVWCRWEQPNLFEDISNPTYDTADTPSKNSNDGGRVIESLETLLQWCKEDPVDTWEMSRNDATERIQGNRNVFIDYPELAWLVFGQTIPTDMDTPSQYAKSSTSCDHHYTDEVIVPTCDAGGYTIHTCSLCGNSYKDSYTAVLGHTDENGDGKCDRCSFDMNDVTPDCQHDYTEVITPPTCVDPGFTTYTCTKCQDSYTVDNTDATGIHDYVDTVTLPTCSTQGYTTHTCSVCRNSYRDTYTSATGDHIDKDGNGICDTCSSEIAEPEALSPEMLVSGGILILLILIFLFIPKKKKRKKKR